MSIQRGEVWIADLNPIRGSEQAGIRPIVIFQNDQINPYTTTIVAIPFTTNLRRASLPSCVLVSAGDGGLSSDSVVLCHQLRVLDRTRLQRRIGKLQQQTMEAIDDCVLFTLGIL